MGIGRILLLKKAYFEWFELINYIYIYIKRISQKHKCLDETFFLIFF